MELRQQPELRLPFGYRRQETDGFVVKWRTIPAVLLPTLVTICANDTLAQLHLHLVPFVLHTFVDVKYFEIVNVASALHRYSSALQRTRDRFCYVTTYVVS